MRAPRATYRLQMRAGFGFREACALASYLNDLGISHLYLSPVFQARKGSQHGYDLTNPLALNPELGSPEDFDALARELTRLEMGMILDIVPNHMAATTENPWWLDVLENGPASPYAAFFDVEWDPAGSNIEEKVLLPILGSPFGTALESGELTLGFDESGFFVRCYEFRLPLAPRSCGALLAHRLENFPGAGMLQPVLEALGKLPARAIREPQALADRYREKERIKREIRDLYAAQPEVQAFMDENLRIFNGKPDERRSFDLLEKLLDEQAYQLAYWKAAKEKVNYRRFFDITDLVGLRSFEPEVFRATHALVLRLAREERISGVRVDHVDGLYDPFGYLERLRAALPPDSYLAVEKILLGGEALRGEWPVEGSTGYDFLNALNGLYADPAGLDTLAAEYRRFTGNEESFEGVAYAQKKRVMDDLFAGDMAGLAHYLTLLTETGRHSRDLGPREVAQALAEVTACMPVYRTYIRSAPVGPEDRAVIERAATEAARRSPALQDAIGFVQRVLLLDAPENLAAEQRQEWVRFVMRWQQFTGPITAKGVEDTALYLYNPLTSLNEVGGEPRARSVEEFHAFNQARAARWPRAMNTSSTHDTKRGEDVRARIHAISEFPDEWSRRLRRWSRWNGAPDRSLEVLLYQALLGAWPAAESELPAFRERMRTYALKAAREAKSRTTWIRKDEAFEADLCRFVEAMLDRSPANRFLPDFLRFQQKIAPHGAWNALSQALLKIAAPGVPDFYQGAETWEYSLVDPDNRRPVDFDRLKRMLDEVKQAAPQDLLANWSDGAVKLYVIWKGLEFRRSRPGLLGGGDYLPLTATGGRAAHVVAFARREGSEWAIAIAPRLTSRFYTGRRPPLRRSWLDTAVTLPAEAPRRWRNVLTGAALDGDGALPLREALSAFPVALLAAEAQEHRGPEPVADGGANR